MSTFQTELSRPALTGAFEANLAALFDLIKHWPQCEVHDTPELMWSITDIPFALFNSVLRTRLPAGKIDETIDSLLSAYRARNVPMMWWIGPSAQPQGLGRVLVERGFHESANPGMAIDLALLPEGGRAPKDLRVKRVESVKELETWNRVVSEVFGMPGFAGDAFFDLYHSLGFDSPLKNYIGSIDKEVVAASSVFHGGGVAGVYNVATLEKARRRGIGTAMTAVPLLESRSEGYRISTLEASKAGFSVYRRLGFQETHTIFHYTWLGD